MQETESEKKLKTNDKNHRYLESGSRIELMLALATITGHVILEISTQGLQGTADSFGALQHRYNLFIAIPWLPYLGWRYFYTPTALEAWGLTKQGFFASLKLSSWFAVPAVAFLIIWGWQADNLPPPAGFWLLFWLYPLYGIAQQFALQGLITKNLRSLFNQTPLRALLAGMLFAIAHLPNLTLAVLVLPMGFIFALIFEKHRNIWALGIVHGILGALAYCLVLGEDPAKEIIEFLNI